MRILIHGLLLITVAASSAGANARASKPTSKANAGQAMVNAIASPKAFAAAKQWLKRDGKWRRGGFVYTEGEPKSKTAAMKVVDGQVEVTAGLSEQGYSELVTWNKYGALGSAVVSYDAQHKTFRRVLLPQTPKRAVAIHARTLNYTLASGARVTLLKDIMPDGKPVTSMTLNAPGRGPGQPWIQVNDDGFAPILGGLAHPQIQQALSELQALAAKPDANPQTKARIEWFLGKVARGSAARK